MLAVPGANQNEMESQVTIRSFSLYSSSSLFPYHLSAKSTMPPPTSSLKPNAPANKAANGSSIGAAKDAAGDDKKFVGKPDQAKYNADQDAVNKEIAAIKSKLVSVTFLYVLVGWEGIRQAVEQLQAGRGY